MKQVVAIVPKHCLGMKASVLDGAQTTGQSPLFIMSQIRTKICGLAMPTTITKSVSMQAARSKARKVATPSMRTQGLEAIIMPAKKLKH